VFYLEIEGEKPIIELYEPLQAAKSSDKTSAAALLR
jgi:hypothetical protein